MKGRIITAIIGAMATATVLSGCNSVQTDVSSNDNATIEESKTVVDEIESTTVSNDGNSELMDGDKLSDEELKVFQDYFNQFDNYGFMLSSYDSPDKIDWGWVFAYGAGIENCDYPQDALDVYLKTNGYESVEYDLIALSGEDVRAFVKAKTGITDFDVSLVDGYTYVEANDILFKQISDTYDKDVICYEGVRNGDSIQVIVQAGINDNKRLVTLAETKDSTNQYLFTSNRELWKEDADQIIEATDFDTGNKITCAVKNSDFGPDIQIIEDDATVQTVYPRRDVGDSAKCKQINEIAFCDVNSDGFTDMIVLMAYDDSTKAVILNGGEDSLGQFEYAIYGSEAITEWLSTNVGNMTVDNVINYINDHQDEYKNL